MAPHSNRDAEGLQPVENHDFPEVVPGQDLRPASARRSSLSHPEVYAPETQQLYPFPSQVNKTGFAHGVVGAYRKPLSEDQFMQNSSPPHYDFPSEKAIEGQQKSKQRRVCGMRRSIFIWVAAIITTLVILAVVLGAALGATLGGDGS